MGTEGAALASQLLDASAFKQKLESLIPSATEQLTIASAYLTRSGANWLSSLIPRICKTTVVVRWRLADLLSGCSDLESYEIAMNNGWAMRIHQDLHAKVWLIDRSAMLVGSGNATAAGLALVENGNWEYGVLLTPRQADIQMLEKRVAEAVVLTEQLFQQLQEVVRESAETVKDGGNHEWPIDIGKWLRPSAVPTALWVAECFQTDGAWLGLPGSKVIASEAQRVDLSLLGVSPGATNTLFDNSILVSALRQTAIYRWLKRRLMDAPTHELYFGELSASLHDALADDPKPYRQTVKTLLANALGWIGYLQVPELRVDTPRYSQRITLLSLEANY